MIIGQTFFRSAAAVRILALGLASLTLAGCQATQGAARKDVRQIVDYHRAIDERSRPRIPIVNNYLSMLGQRVLEAAQPLGAADPKNTRSSREPLHIYERFDVLWVHDVPEVACTRGDDYALVSTALLLEVQSPGELIAVLCHEFAHIAKQHNVQNRYRIRREADKTVALAAIAGGLGGAAGVGTALAGPVIQSRQQFMAAYDPRDKSDEFEADEYGLRIYANMGLDPAHFDDFFERELAQHGDTGGTTHPRHSERIARIRMLAAKVPVNNSPPQHFDTMALRQVQHAIVVSFLDSVPGVERYEYAQMMLSMQNQRLLVYPAQACGPIDGDPATMRAELAAAAARHRPAP